MYLSSRWSGAEIHYPPSLLHPFQRERERERDEFKKADEGGGRSALRKIKVLAPRDGRRSRLSYSSSSGGRWRRRRLAPHLPQRVSKEKDGSAEKSGGYALCTLGANFSCAGPALFVELSDCRRATTLLQSHSCGSK